MSDMIFLFFTGVILVVFIQAFYAHPITHKERDTLFVSLCLSVSLARSLTRSLSLVSSLLLFFLPVVVLVTLHGPPMRIHGS